MVIIFLWESIDSDLWVDRVNAVIQLDSDTTVVGELAQRVAGGRCAEREWLGSTPFGNVAAVQLFFSCEAHAAAAAVSRHMSHVVDTRKNEAQRCGVVRMCIKDPV